jgi:hypothetical protein
MCKAKKNARTFINAKIKNRLSIIALLYKTIMSLKKSFKPLEIGLQL